MSEDTSFSKKKSKKSSRNSDEEEEQRKHKKVEETDEKQASDEDDEKKSHKRKHKKHKKDKKEKRDDADDDAVDEEKLGAPTCKNKKSDDSDENKEKEEDSTASNLGIEIHTANNWEKADLGGDEKRKLKFLKLMGAAKHQDTADDKSNTSQQLHQHSRPVTEIKKIDADLEKQFTEGLTSKINRTNHIGLGFAAPGAIVRPPTAPVNTRKTFDDDEDDAGKKKSEAIAPAPAKEDPRAKYKKMTFVKSNNS